ncbi:hypothetical protein D3C77_239890 [compost metagenome]
MKSSVNFYQADLPATLFPLKTNLLLVSHHSGELSDYIYQRVINSDCPADGFLAQQKVYATKPKGHLRRTVKLDPVAEYFIYDIIYRNRSIFRPEVSESRKSFGYRFKNGSYIPVHSAYSEYKKNLQECVKLYAHSARFDIASYFNSLYHHDVAHWFSSNDNVTKTDANALSQFFREINSGRSVDFMPHGIYPTKMIGNEFLKFVDLHGQLKSAQIVRFMDDFAVFDNDPDVINRDFIKIQQLIGQFGLNVNPSKTDFDSSYGCVSEALTEIQSSLLEVVPSYKLSGFTPSGVGVIEWEEDGEIVEKDLSTNQIDALLGILKNESIEETDADRILEFLRSHSDSLLDQLPTLLLRFPNLIKHIHSICAEINDKKRLVSVIDGFLDKKPYLLEYQIFWLASIIEDYLLTERGHGDLLIKLFELSADYKIARSKILEIPIQGFGFKEIRNEYLKTGQSDWLSWASAAGSRTLKAAERNYVLDYFSKASPLNYLVAECIKKI